MRRTPRSTPLLLTTLLVALIGVLLPVSAAQGVGTSTIRGDVFVTGGTPLAGVVVDLYARTDPTAPWESVATTTTDEFGAYVLSDVAPGTYRVGFDDLTGTYEDEYWSNYSTLQDAIDLVVGPDESLDNISAVLYARDVPSGMFGAITGTVTGLQPTDAVKVSAYQNVDGAWTVTRFIWVGFDGTYRLNLRAGTYRIGFEEEHNHLAPEFWNDAATVDRANDIIVAEDTVTPGKDAVLTSIPVATPPVAAPVPVVPAPSRVELANVRKPTITGKAKMGKRLRVTSGAWTLGSGVSFTYQWLADGRKIKKATRARLKVTAGLVGTRLRVLVTARTADAKATVRTGPTSRVVD